MDQPDLRHLRRALVALRDVSAAIAKECRRYLKLDDQRVRRQQVLDQQGEVVSQKVRLARREYFDLVWFNTLELFERARGLAESAEARRLHPSARARRRIERLLEKVREEQEGRRRRGPR